MHIHTVTKSKVALASDTTGTLDSLLSILQSLSQVISVLNSVYTFFQSFSKTS